MAIHDQDWCPCQQNNRHPHRALPATGENRKKGLDSQRQHNVLTPGWLNGGERGRSCFRYAIRVVCFMITTIQPLRCDVAVPRRPPSPEADVRLGQKPRH